MEWSQPETQGTYVTPRGGHASTLIEENWYIVGGGDNKSGNYFWLGTSISIIEEIMFSFYFLAAI